MEKIIFILLILGLVLLSCVPSNTSPSNNETNNPPTQPSNPSPSDGTTDVTLTPTLSWEASDSDGDTLTFDIYFGTESTPTLVKSDSATNTYKPGTLNSKTKYYWKIVAKDGKDGVSKGPVWSFTTLNNPPKQPSDPSPSNGQTDVSVSPTLSWTASDPDGDTLTYSLYLSTDTSPELYEEELETNSIKVGPLENGTTYYWRVEALDGKGGVVSSPVWCFQTGNYPPSQPLNPIPSDGATDVSLTPTLSWEASDPDGDILTFDIYFGTESNPPLLESNLSTNTYNPGTLNSKTTYYWKVVAKDGKGGETEGPVWSFTTLNNPPIQPSEPSPSNGQTDVSLTQTLSWSASDPDGDTLTFDVCFGTSSNPPLVKSNLTGNIYALGTLESGTTYYWKIVVKDGKGGETEGPVWSFTTLNNPPKQPSDPYPLDGQIKVPLFLTLTWTASDPDGDTLTYNLYLSKTSPPELYLEGIQTNSKEIGPLESGTTYYWKVEANDRKGGVTPSPIWSFTTAEEGSIKWTFKTAGGITSSPAIGPDGTIYIGSGGYLYAINPDGTEKWKVEIGAISSPAIGTDGTIYVGNSIGYLYAINPNGTEKWKVETIGSLNRSSPAIGSGGTIYIVSSDDTNYNYYLYAINPDETEKWKVETRKVNYSSPAIGPDGTIYLGSEGGILYAINPDGTEKWEIETGQQIYSSLAIGLDGTIYVRTCLHDYLYAINPDGTRKWRFEIDENRQWDDDVIYSSPVTGPDGTIYIGGGGTEDYLYLYAIKPDGTRKWRFKTTSSYVDGSNYTITIAIGSNGTIYVGSSTYNTWSFYAINPDGTIKWKSSIGRINRSSPAIGPDGTIYIGHYTGVYTGEVYDYLYAIYSSSKGLADSPWPKFMHNNQNTGNFNH